LQVECRHARRRRETWRQARAAVPGSTVALDVANRHPQCRPFPAQLLEIDLASAQCGQPSRTNTSSSTLRESSLSLRSACRCTRQPCEQRHQQAGKERAGHAGRKARSTGTAENSAYAVEVRRAPPRHHEHCQPPDRRGSDQPQDLEQGLASRKRRAARGVRLQRLEEVRASRCGCASCANSRTSSR